MKSTKIALFACAAVLALGGAAPAAAQAIAPPADPLPAEPSLAQAITGGHLLVDVRSRYEFVDQQKTATLTDNAEAYTVRTRIGWETAFWNGLQMVVEGKAVRDLAAERYAVNVPGATTPPLNGADRARYPLVNDPETTELERAQLTWKSIEAFEVTGGRQRILIDDQRFVGDVGWRQDDQTFDAVRTDVKLGQVRLFYAYLFHINRILGTQRDWDSDSHLVNLVWSPATALQLEGFLYALDFSNSAANTSLTKGLKVSGAYPAGPVKLAYHATFARETDYRHATTPYGLDYWSGDIAASAGMFSGRASYESLQGNGVRGFITPLATTFQFQGWADAFVQPLGGDKSFVDGLKDFNLTFDVKPPLSAPHLFKPDLMVVWHDFHDQRTGAALGREWDALAQANLTKRLTAQLRFANFERVTTVPTGTALPPPSRTKVWFTLEYQM